MVTSEDSIAVLRKDLYEHPSASLLIAARWVRDLWPREYLPDWVECLANGDVEKWEAVIEVTKAEIEGEAKDALTMPVLPLRHGDQRGQGVVDFALLLAGLAVICFVLFAWIPTTPAGRMMGQMAGQAVTQLEAAASMHATERHGAAALNVASELSCSGAINRIRNPTTGRWANTCQVGDKFGVLIEDPDGSCVTCFIKDKLNTYEQVLKYLANRGYTE